jgi:DNA-binding NarL/FixJ family response regulator
LSDHRSASGSALGGWRSQLKHVGVDPDDRCRGEGDTVLVRPRLLIVDDHVGFRSVARALLQADGFDVVGEAADGTEALVEAALVEPDLVLLDVHLPGADGFAVSELLSHLRRPPKVVLTSSRPVSDLRGRLERCAAIAFLPKDELSGRSLAAAAGL